MRRYLVLCGLLSVGCGSMSQFEKREWMGAATAGVGAGVAVNAPMLLMLDGAPVRDGCPPGPGLCPETWNTDGLAIGAIVVGAVLIVAAAPVARWLFPTEKD